MCWQARAKSRYRSGDNRVPLYVPNYYLQKKLKKHNEEQWRLATSKAAVMNVPFGKLISRAGNVIM